MQPDLVQTSRRRWAELAGAAAVGALPLLYAGMYAGDAAIHLVFAEHAAGGAPFTFNPGQRVPGVTSPGYMWLLAGLWRVVGPELLPVAVKLLDSAVWLAFVGLVWRLALRAVGDRAWALAATLAVGLMPGSAYNATIGMENGLFALVVAAAILLAERRVLLGPAAPAAALGDLGIGALIGLGFWVRPEAALVGAAWFPARLAAACGARRGVRGVLAGASLALAIAVAELLHHRAYTGVWLPGSARARAVFGGLHAVTFGPLRFNPEFAARLVAYAPLLALAVVGAWMLARRQADPALPAAASRRLVGWGLAFFALGFVAYSTQFGTAHLGRYTIFLWPFLALGAATGGRGLWARWPIGLAAWRRPAFVTLGLALAAVYGYEAWRRHGLGTHDAVADCAAAPSGRRAASDALLVALGNPAERPVVVAYQEVQQRYWLDERFEVRSLDGRTDPLLLDYVREGFVDHAGYLRAAGVQFVMELPDYNRDRSRWSLASLASLEPGASATHDGLRFEPLASGAVRVVDQRPPTGRAADRRSGARLAPAAWASRQRRPGGSLRSLPAMVRGVPGRDGDERAPAGRGHLAARRDLGLDDGAVRSRLDHARAQPQRRAARGRPAQPDVEVGGHGRR